MGKFGNLEEVEKEYGVNSGGKWLNKIPVGENKYRIVSQFYHFGEHWDGMSKVCIGKESGCKYCNDGKKPNLRFLGWIIDRADGKFKIMKTGHSVVKQISALDEKDDYKFGEDGLPKYDITITRVGETKTDTKYTILPGRKDTKLTEEELEKQKELKDPLEIIVAMKEKLNVEEPDSGEISKEDMPI